MKPTDHAVRFAAAWRRHETVADVAAEMETTVTNASWYASYLRRRGYRIAKKKTGPRPKKSRK